MFQLKSFSGLRSTTPAPPQFSLKRRIHAYLSVRFATRITPVTRVKYASENKRLVLIAYVYDMRA
jgi:hypothetical protein